MKHETKKADYSKIASSYDEGRRLLEQNTSLWMNLISTYSGAGPGARVLDLGCGTGRFAVPMSTQLDYRVTGVDSSPDMLEKARAKDPDGRMTWEVGNADDIRYGEASFEMVFISHLMHHVDDPSQVVKSCHRIIADGGTVLIRYGAIERIREDPEHVFFPEVLTFDEARTPSISMVEGWMTAEGFSDVRSVSVVQKTYETPRARLQAASVKSTSVLSMISDDAFEQGLRGLAEYIKAKPEDPWLLMDSLTLSIGHRRPA